MVTLCVVHAFIWVFRPVSLVVGGSELDVEVSAPEHLTHAGVLALIEVDQGAFTGNKHHHVLVDKKDYA